MFYRITVQDHIRVPPIYFGKSVEESVLAAAKHKFEGYIDAELGIVVDVADVRNVGEGRIIPGDGAAYYESEVELVAFKPEIQEVLMGRVRDITDFGAFITLGPIDGMIHISQTMDDYVSFAKEKVLTGRDSKRVLKVNDTCRARVIAVSFKDITNPKIGLTMRQPGLGKPEWTEETAEKKEGKAAAEKKPAKGKEKKPKGKKK